MKKHLRKLHQRGEPVAAAPIGSVAPIARKSNIPQAAFDWLVSKGITPPAENRLEIRNEGDTHEIYLTGSVGSSWYDDGGITAKEFRAAIGKIPNGKPITISLNSTGGAVGEGLDIYNAIKERRADVTVKISGYALSIASVFPLAAGKVISPKAAIWMIHLAWSWLQGNADDAEKFIQMMRTHDETLAGIYAESAAGRKIAKSKADFLTAMKAETWIKGADAMEWGLADETDTDEPEPAASAAAPQAGAQSLQSPATPPANQHNPQPPTKMNEPTPTAAAQPVAPTPAAPVAAAPAPAPVASASTGDSVSRAEFQKVLDALEAQKKSAVEAKILAFVQSGVITNDEASIYVNAALKDEAGTLAILNKKEPVYAGSVISVGISSNMPAADGVMQMPEIANIVNAHKDDKEGAFKKVLANWDAFYKKAEAMDRKRGATPMNANSITGFLTAFLLQGSLTPLQNKWAPLMALCRDYSTDPYKPLATATLKNPTAAASTLTDATSFNSGNSTVGALTATMHQYTQPFQISNTDLNSGLRMEDLVTINQAAFADKIISVALAPVTAANFTGTGVISSAAAFGFNELAFLQGQLQKANKKNLILDGAYIARVANTPGFFQQAGTVAGNPGAWSAFGWDGIYLNSNWTGAGTNVKGIALDPQAIFGIMGLPLTPVSGAGGGIFNVNTVTIPGVNVSVAIYTWWDVNTRTMWTSYDLVAGFGLGDATAGYLVTSA